MIHPVEKRIRTPSNHDVHESAKQAFPDNNDAEIIAELMRMITFVAVCYNDVVEGDQDAATVFDRHIFIECDDLAGWFPWPED